MKNTPQLHFEVKDTGIGITRDNQARIFDSFSQADDTTTRKYGGTGLGLAISKQLVELMGGDIGVESTPDQGTTFWFTVPLDQVPDTPDTARDDRKVLADLRLLVVDDNNTIREALAHQVARIRGRLWRGGERPGSVAATTLGRGRATTLRCGPGWPAYARDGWG